MRPNKVETCHIAPVALNAWRWRAVRTCALLFTGFWFLTVIKKYYIFEFISVVIDDVINDHFDLYQYAVLVDNNCSIVVGGDSILLFIHEGGSRLETTPGWW